MSRDDDGGGVRGGDGGLEYPLTQVREVRGPSHL